MNKKKRICVRELMKESFTTIDSRATIYEALRKMKQMRTSLLVVEKRHADDQFGLLLVADIANEVLARDRAPTRVNVYEVMQKPAPSVHPDMDIQSAPLSLARRSISAAENVSRLFVLIRPHPEHIAEVALAVGNPVGGVHIDAGLGQVNVVLHECADRVLSLDDEGLLRSDKFDAFFLQRSPQTIRAVGEEVELTARGTGN